MMFQPQEDTPAAVHGQGAESWNAKYARSESLVSRVLLQIM